MIGLRFQLMPYILKNKGIRHTSWVHQFRFTYLSNDITYASFIAYNTIIMSLHWMHYISDISTNEQRNCGCLESMNYVVGINITPILWINKILGKWRKIMKIRIIHVMVAIYLGYTYGVLTGFTTWPRVSRFTHTDIRLNTLSAIPTTRRTNS